MDLKSVLNDDSTAAGRSNTANMSGRSFNNRTPWSAGGYSLPILTNPFSSVLETDGYESCANNCQDLQRIGEDQRPKDLPESPTALSTRHRQTEGSYDNLIEGARKRFSESSHGVQHRLSDSRSSLSSFVSSPYSSTHSRFSSVSTINEYHPAYNPETESFPSYRQDFWEKDQVSLSPPSTSSTSIPPSRSRASTIPSAESITGLARIAEHHLEGVGTNQVAQVDRATCSSEGDCFQFRDEDNKSTQTLAARSTSPSDALIIRRTFQENPTYNEPFERHQTDHFSSEICNSRQYSPKSLVALQGTAHERLSSASLLLGSYTDEVVHLPTHSTSNFPTHSPSKLGSLPCTHPSKATCNASHSEPKQITSTLPEPRCMFMEGCDTNSVPRKAVSHVFGRNKMCTRLIPPHVWVRYCRKHYQRAVYRNPKGWPRLQCDLVQEQIKRLDTWTSENIRKGEGGVVNHWTLALRRREQVRRESLQGDESNTSKVETDHEYESDEDGPKHRRSGGHPPVPVPDWLFRLCGTGYSSEQIAQIIDTIHRDIRNEILSGIPDIELLPQIDTDRGSRKSTKVPVPHQEPVRQRSPSVDRLCESSDRSRPDGSERYKGQSNIPASRIGSSTKRKHYDGNGIEGVTTTTMPQNQRIRLGMSKPNHKTPDDTVALISKFISHRPRRNSQHRLTSCSNVSTTVRSLSFASSDQNHENSISPTSDHLAAAQATLSLYDRPVHQRSQSEISAVRSNGTGRDATPMSRNSYRGAINAATKSTHAKGHGLAGDCIYLNRR